MLLYITIGNTRFHDKIKVNNCRKQIKVLLFEKQCYWFSYPERDNKDLLLLNINAVKYACI